eukprot:41189-Pyramimonas_sp.AAC.1
MTISSALVDAQSTLTINGQAVTSLVVALNPGACQTVTLVVTPASFYAASQRTYTLRLCRLSVAQQLSYFSYARDLSTPIIANDGVPDLWSVAATNWAASGTNIPASQIAQMNLAFNVYLSNGARVTSGSVALVGGAAAWGLSPNTRAGNYVLILQEVATGTRVPVRASQPIGTIGGNNGIAYNIVAGAMDIRMSTVEYSIAITVENAQYFIRARDAFGNMVTTCANTIPVASLVFSPPGSTATCLNGVITVRFAVPVAGTYTLRAQYLGVDIGVGKGLLTPAIREVVSGGFWTGLGGLGGFQVTIAAAGISARFSEARVAPAGYSPVGVLFEVVTRNQDNVFAYVADTRIVVTLIDPATGLPAVIPGYTGAACFQVTNAGGTPTYTVRYVCAPGVGLPTGTYTMYITVNANDPLKPLGGNIGGGAGRFTLLISNPLATPQDTYLEQLQISPGQYSPLFSQTVITYEAWVQYSQTDVTVIAASLIRPPDTRLFINGLETTRLTVRLNADPVFTTAVLVRLDSVFVDPANGRFATRTYTLNIRRYTLDQMTAFYRFARTGLGAACQAACNNRALYPTCGGANSGAVSATLETQPNVQFGIYVDSAAWGPAGVASKTYITPSQIGPIQFSYRLSSAVLVFEQTFDIQVTGACGFFSWGVSAVADFRFVTYLFGNAATVMNPSTGISVTVQHANMDLTLSTVVHWERYSLGTSEFEIFPRDLYGNDVTSNDPFPRTIQPTLLTVAITPAPAALAQPLNNNMQSAGGIYIIPVLLPAMPPTGQLVQVQVFATAAPG